MTAWGDYETIGRAVKSIGRMSPEARQALKDEMRAALIACAKAQQTITYSELALQLQTARLHPHSFVFSGLLREVCAEEEQAGHGQLCALVVSKLTGMPSGGYFRGTFTNLDIEDLKARWRADLAEVFKRWEQQ